jgi:carboxyl-terminal processing protease
MRLLKMDQNVNFDGGYETGKEEKASPATVGVPVAPKNKKPITVSLPLTILLVLLAALLTFQTTFVTLSIKHNYELTKAKSAIGKMQVLAEAYELFGDQYIYDIDIDTLVNDMLHAFNAQDKYSAYYSFEEYLAMTQGSNGSAKGIGVYVSGTQTSIIVSYVMPGSPAERAGVLAGDSIIAVDGIYVKDAGYNEVVNKVSGENGTQVVLKIQRGEDVIDIPVTRGDYTPYTVIHSVMEENGEKIGYVKLIQFDSITVSQFKTAVEDLKSKGCGKFIFDLRGNPGGELNSVVAMLDYILPKGPIVHILDADKNETQVYESDASELVGEMVVLADGNTASAGELFTSALRDYEKATIIGTKTYGKGCGQSFHPLSNGGYITVTSFFYNPPYGENYDGIGIYPDIEVELPEEYKNANTLLIPKESDTQLAAAISELTK